jgi:D-glycero-alpha-D-manno-heptose-7-phosphate kinase
VTTTIRSSAPIRICDTGGWTDTWFAGSGAVFSIAVAPRIEVVVVAIEGEGVDLRTPDAPGPHPLLHAAIGSAAVPDGVRLVVEIRAGVPPGAGTGTSAVVVVALLAALDRLTPGVAEPMALARAAHRVETVLLGQESGVQDQLAAAFGGINRFDVEYPEATVHPIPVTPATRAALAARLVLVTLGRPHRSSAVHREVIAALRSGAPEPADFDALRAAAHRSSAACAAGDLDELGRAMVDNHEAQRALHPRLISAEADAVVAVARAHGAVGWKVNGAGGDGGSLTLLAGDSPDDHGRLVAALDRAGVGEVVPVTLATKGVEVWTSNSEQ